jgi:pilus assembly protein FimV
MNRSLKLSILLALTVGGGQAAAVELGQIHVKSALGQPLLADIPVTPEGPADLANLSARLASSEDFAQAGIAGGRPSIPLTFSVAKAGSGKVIRITSSQAINDPLLDLLVEVDSASGKSVREFTILLDPPGGEASPPVLRAPVGHGRSAARARSAAASAPAESRTAGAGVAVSNGRFGPVQSGQNLSSLARSVASSGANINQMMLALKQANPGAFYRDNINALKSGVVLRVPSADEAKAQSAAAALAEVRRQNSDWRAGVTHAPTSVADAATRATTSSSPSASAASHADHLSLTPSKDAGQGAASQSGSASSGKSSVAMAGVRQDLLRSQESLAALQQQGNDLKSRLKDLEDINSKNQKLLSLKDNEIAELQHKLEDVRKAGGAAAPTAEKPAMAVPTTPSAAPASSSSAVPAPAVAAPASHAAGTAPALASSAASAAAVTKPAQVPAKKPVVAPRPAPVAEEPWYMQTWAWGVGAAAIVVLLLLALLGRRKPAAKAAEASSLADRFDTVSPTSDDDEDIDQEELLDQLAEHPDDIGLHLELVSLYYHRRDIEHFEAAAEAMQAHVVDPEQSEWQDVMAMGEDLVPEHPLFAGGPGYDNHAYDDHAYDSHAHEPHAADAPHDGQEALHAFDLDSYAATDAAGPAPLEPKPGHPKVSEYHFDFNLTPRAKTEGATPPLPAADSDPYEDVPHRDAYAASPLADDASSVATHQPESTWTFAAPVEEAGTAADADLEPFTDDPVDTKLDLARAYLDMGDAEGARAMLDEVLHEGSQMQRDVAKRLLDDLV